MKLFPTYPGIPLPPKDDILKTPLSILNAVSALVKTLGIKDKLLALKDRILASKDAEIATLKKENSSKDSEIASLRKKNHDFAHIIKELRHRLGINSTNSSLPPSKDPIGFDRKKAREEEKGKGKPKEEGKKPTQKEEKPKRPYHPGAQQPVLTPTQELDCTPEVCPHCGCHHFESLQKHHTHQHIELPENPLIVTHFHVYSGRCSQCGHETKGTVPEEYRAFYGPRLSAFIAYIDSATGTTRRQIQRILKDVLGLPISQGGIQKVIDRASKALIPLYERIAEGVRRSLYNHVDETSWPTHGPVLGKMLHWLWVMGNAFLARFRVDPHRSSEAFDKLVGIWKGLLHTDDYGMYRKWAGKRQPCLAHYLRRARRLAESSDAEEARCGKRILSLLQDLCSAANQPLPQNFYENLEARTRRLLSDFGDLAGKAGCLVLRIFNDIDMLTYFLRDPLASKTNNFAEGLVRSSVCQRKISFGSAAEKGEHWIERSLSVRKSCELNNKSYFEILVDALAALARGGRPNMYWIRKAALRSTQPEFAQLRAH